MLVVRFGFVWSSGFSLALTSFFYREGLAIYAITGVLGKSGSAVHYFFINFQCFLKILLIPFILSVLCSKYECQVVWFGLSFFKASFLSLYGISLICLITWLGL